MKFKYARFLHFTVFAVTIIALKEKSFFPLSLSYVGLPPLAHFVWISFSYSMWKDYTATTREVIENFPAWFGSAQRGAISDINYFNVAQNEAYSISRTIHQVIFHLSRSLARFLLRAKATTTTTMHIFFLFVATKPHLHRVAVFI